MRHRPLRDQARSVPLDLARPARERTHGSGEFGDLAGVIQSVPVARKCGDPRGVCARGELAFGVDDGMQLHRDARVEVRPLAVRTEHLDVQPEVAVDVRVERSGSAVLQLDDLDARDLLTNEPITPAPRVEFGLPREQDALTQPVLECLELARELRMQQRCDAVRLRVVERPVQ